MVTIHTACNNSFTTKVEHCKRKIKRKEEGVNVNEGEEQEHGRSAPDNVEQHLPPDDGPGHIVSGSAHHCLVSLLGQCGHYDFYLSSYPLIFLVPCDNTTHNLHHQIASDRGCGFIIIMHFLNIHI